jgi:hypothetical protein
MMKRLAIAAFLLLAATPVRTEAGSLPKPKSLIDRTKATHQTHYVRDTRAKLPGPIRNEHRDTHRGFRQSHAVRGK